MVCVQNVRATAYLCQGAIVKTVIGYENGRTIWSENTPSEPLNVRGWWAGGSIVSGTPRPVARGIAAAKERLAAGAPPPEPRKCADLNRRYATDEERIEARRRSFRESKVRARERQAAERAALRAEIVELRQARAS